MKGSKAAYYKDEPKKTKKRDFVELVRCIPTEQFARMVSKCALPTQDARDLCEAFMELKK